MPEGPDGKTIIIVKKVSGHGGHHGGAWKVAYADFVTAMMALFMVLWLVNSASVTTRERIASYFREPGVFEKGSGTPLEEGGAGILPDAFSPPADENSQSIHSVKIYKVAASLGEKPDAFDIASGEGPGKDDVKIEGHSDLEKLAKKIEEQLKDAAKIIGEQGKLVGKIEVKVDQRGLHIEIMDTDKASMFELGSSKMSPLAETELGKISKILATLPNPVDIEGHTDGRPFNEARTPNYDNWNLSVDRANSARRALLGAGMKSKQIARVVGYADQRLKFPADPLAAGNRRISISMRFTELASKALEGSQTQVTEAKPVAPINGKPPESSEGKTPEGKQAGDAAAKGEGKNRLEVKVEATAPEGEVINPGESQEEKTWMEKDKIFNNKNPFFPG